MTGSILPHKNLVTNYGLLSSVEEAARASSQSIRGNSSMSSSEGVPPFRAIDVVEEASSSSAASIGPSRVPSMETMETIAVTPASVPAEYAQAPPLAADAHDDNYDYSSSN
jgi:hypothetical protein